MCTPYTSNSACCCCPLTRTRRDIQLKAFKLGLYKIKITETGVMKTDEAGHSDSISEVPGHPKEILEGAFLRQTGKKLRAYHTRL